MIKCVVHFAHCPHPGSDPTRGAQILFHSTTTFIAHLINKSLAHEIITLQIFVLLLEWPMDDSVEIAVGSLCDAEVSAFLSKNSPKANAYVYECFRVVLNEGSISQRVQFMVEVLMQPTALPYTSQPTPTHPMAHCWPRPCPMRSSVCPGCTCTAPTHADS